MDAKPILVIRIPVEILDSKDKITSQIQDLQNRMNDYHIIPVFESGIEKTSFECYNPPMEEITMNKLQEINELIKNIFN